MVIPESLPAGVERARDNLNDRTSEGIALTARRAFSVQYHPEAAPGPHDATELFEAFVRVMEGG